MFLLVSFCISCGFTYKCRCFVIQFLTAMTVLSPLWIATCESKDGLTLFLWFSILGVPLLMLIPNSFLQRNLWPLPSVPEARKSPLALWEEDADRGHRLRTELCSIYKFQLLKPFLCMSRFSLHFQALWGLLSFLEHWGLLVWKSF